MMLYINIDNTLIGVKNLSPYTESMEKALDGVFGHIIGQVAQEGGVWRAARQA